MQSSGAVQFRVKFLIDQPTPVRVERRGWVERMGVARAREGARSVRWVRMCIVCVWFVIGLSDYCAVRKRAWCGLCAREVRRRRWDLILIYSMVAETIWIEWTGDRHRCLTARSVVPSADIQYEGSLWPLPARHYLPLRPSCVPQHHVFRPRASSCTTAVAWRTRDIAGSVRFSAGTISNDAIVTPRLPL